MDEKIKIDAASNKAEENGEEASRLSDEDLNAVAGGQGPQHQLGHKLGQPGRPPM